MDFLFSFLFFASTDGGLGRNCATNWGFLRGHQQLDGKGQHMKYKDLIQHFRICNKHEYFVIQSMLKDDEFFKEIATSSPNPSVTDDDSNV